MLGLAVVFLVFAEVRSEIPGVSPEILLHLPGPAAAFVRFSGDRPEAVTCLVETPVGYCGTAPRSCAILSGSFEVLQVMADNHQYLHNKERKFQ